MTAAEALDQFAEWCDHEARKLANIPHWAATPVNAGECMAWRKAAAEANRRAQELRSCQTTK